MSRGNATAAKVKAVNRANKEAIKLYEQLAPIFAPLVGQQVMMKGGLLAKFQKLLPELPNTSSLSIHRHLSDYYLGWTVKTSEMVDDTSCLYHEVTVQIGTLNHGVLESITSPFTGRTDWTLEEIEKKRETFRAADKALSDARSALYPFGERYDLDLRRFLI